MYKRLQNTEREGEEDLRLLLIGKTGSGKSATGNTIFNETVFVSEMSSSSVTRVCQTHTRAVNNRSVTVIDTPDFIFSTHTDFDSHSELKRALELCSAGAHVILLILPLRAVTGQEMDFIHWFELKFGAEALRFTLVLFTHADQRHMRTLGEMISRNSQLSDFINRCGRRYHEFNLKAPANRQQVNELMEKINRLVFENTNSCYTLDMMKENERRREQRERTSDDIRQSQRRRDRDHQMMEHQRSPLAVFENTVLIGEGDDVDGGLQLLLIGKTGSGKSSTGNTIFNDQVFVSEMRSSSVTRVSQTHTGAVNNRSVTVIDTPDFRFSTHTDFDSHSELKRALELCSAGAHVILLILSLSTFTEQEMDFIHWFELKFGAEALRFTLVLFTHADQRHMRTLGEMISRNSQLSDFINRCGRRYHEFNIKAPANREQVNELMEKIGRLVSENTNSCYTLDMMKENERRREEEERRVEEEREREHQRRLDRVREETEARVRREYQQEVLEKERREDEERIERIRRETEIPVREQCAERRVSRFKHFVKQNKCLILAGVVVVIILIVIAVRLSS